MRRFMSKVMMVAVLVILTSSLALAEVLPKVGKYVKVYKGSEGLYLTVLKIGPPENNESLFLIEGIDHPWDGKIMVAKVHNRADRTEYSILVEGQRFTAFRNKSGSGEVFLMNVKNPNAVHYHEERSRQVKPEHILSKLLKQQNKAK